MPNRPGEQLWTLYERPGGMTWRQLLYALERAAADDPADPQTRQLIYEGLRSLTPVIGLGHSRAVVRGSAQREAFEIVRRERFGETTFPTLLERVTLVEAWEEVRGFLNCLDGALELDEDSRLGRRFRRRGMTPPQEKLDVLIGGSASLMMATWLTRRVETVTHVDPLSKGFTPYAPLLAAAVKESDRCRWLVRDSTNLPTGWRDRVVHYHGFAYLSVASVDPIDAFSGLFFTLDAQDRTDLFWTAKPPNRGMLRSGVADVASQNLPEAIRVEATRRWHDFAGEARLPAPSP